MNVTRPSFLPWLSVTVVLLALCGLKLQQLVDFLRDAQYYVQSSLLWPRGEVGFAGSLIGGRDLVVLTYHGAMTLLGPSTDALSVTMAVLYGCCGLFLAVVCFASLRGATTRSAAAITAAALAFLLTAWSYPASDGPGVAMLAAMWATWAAWLRLRRGWLLWLLLPLAAGLATHVRSELVLFALVVGVFAVAPRWFARGAGTSRARMMATTGAAAGVFVIAAAVPTLAWPLWVPVDKPPVYAYVFPLFRAFDDLAHGRNGPASSELARMLGLSPDAKIPFWQALGNTYSTLGPRDSDRLMARAALEGLHASPSKFAGGVARTLCAELCSGASGYPAVAIEHGELARRRARQAESLVELDAVRRSHSAQFGGDPFIETAALADRSIPWVERIRQRLGGFEASVRLPFVAAPMLALALVAIAALRPARRALLLPVATYALVLSVLVAFTQGGLDRYMEGAVLLQAVALVIAGLAIMERG